MVKEEWDLLEACHEQQRQRLETEQEAEFRDRDLVLTLKRAEPIEKEPCS